MTDQQETDQQSFDRHAWIEGSIPVFKAFFFQYYPAFFPFAASLLPDRLSATHVTTEAFFLLWKKHKDLESLVNCKAFLYTTIRNHSLQYLKYLREDPDAGVYRADDQRWPALPDKDLVEILAYAEGYDPSS